MRFGSQIHPQHGNKSGSTSINPSTSQFNSKIVGIFGFGTNIHGIFVTSSLMNQHLPAKFSRRSPGREYHLSGAAGKIVPEFCPPQCLFESVFFSQNFRRNQVQSFAQNA